MVTLNQVGAKRECFYLLSFLIVVSGLINGLMLRCSFSADSFFQGVQEDKGVRFPLSVITDHIVLQYIDILMYRQCCFIIWRVPSCHAEFSKGKGVIREGNSGDIWK